MKGAILIAVLLSCTSPDRALATLKAEGFTHIAIGDYAFMSCGRDDSTCTGFSAIGPSGVHVHGAVGCGYDTGCSKGCTVRIVP